MIERLEKIEQTLEEHTAAIFGLRESARKLEAGQKMHSNDILDLSTGFGAALREISKIGERFQEGKKELLSTMHGLSDVVLKVQSDQAHFRREWNAVCDQKHQHIDFRLNNVESCNAAAIKNIEEMSENSKVHYIQNLELQLREYSEELKRRETERLADIRQRDTDISADKRSIRSEKIRLIGIIVAGLLTGTGGTIVLQWLLSG